MTDNVTVSKFRADFPAFKNSTIVPDGTIQFWLDFVQNGPALDPGRWGNWWTTGIELFVAHNTALDTEAAGDAARGLPPGFSQGVLNSQSVDKASAGYDTSSVLDPNAGHWNLTIYGQRLYRMMRIIGAGPVTVAGCEGVNVSAESAGTPYWGFGNYPLFP